MDNANFSSFYERLLEIVDNVTMGCTWHDSKLFLSEKPVLNLQILVNLYDLNHYLTKDEHMLGMPFFNSVYFLSKLAAQHLVSRIDSFIRF